MIDFKEYSELFHHGIKNQKWGVRNGPPYPLDRSKSAKIKAGNNDQTPKEGISVIAANLLAFTATYGVTLAIVGGGMAIDNAIQAGKEKKLYKEENNPNKLTRKNLKKVNPNFGKPGYTENCSKCSIVTELVSRGITDYEVGKGNGLPRGFHTKAFKGAKEDKLEYTNKTTMSKQFAKYPNGASGSFGFTYSSGMSGHSIHWTKLKDGTIRFEDGQNGKSYNLDDFIKTYQPGEMYSSSLIRLDNCKPNYKVLEQLEVLSPVKKKK